MKTLFFVLACFLFCPIRGLAAENDPYISLPWHSVKVGDIPETRSVASPIADISAFRKVLAEQNPTFTATLTHCGMPSAECDYADIKNVRTIPTYPTGHLFRYDVGGNEHVYIWIVGTNGITLAIFHPKSGPTELLYK